jgi:stage II sporulation protein E
LEGLSGSAVSDNIVLSILEAVIAVVSAVIFKYGMDYIMQVSRTLRMNNEQMVSVALMVAVAVYAIPNFKNTYVSWLDSAVYFIILFFTYKYGVGQGTITGAVCGFTMSLKGAPVENIGSLTMIGILPAVFREMGRVPTTIIYILTAAMMGLFNPAMILSIEEIGALITAAALFLLLPRHMVFRVDAAGGTGRQEYLAAQNLKKIAETRMRIFSDSFLKLSKTLDKLTQNQTKLKQREIDLIFEDISEKLCKSCTNCSYCWEHKFQKTYQAACLMFEKAEKNGSLNKEDIPEEFLSDCICADEFIRETNRGFEIAKLNNIWHSRITESREVIAEQLKEVSNVIQDITGEIYETAQGSYSDEERVLRRLKAEHVLAKDITIFERGDKRKEIYLSAACQGGRCITAKEAANVISDAMGVRMKVSEASKSVVTQDYENFTFVEDTKFKVLTGVARAKKDNVSGDNFSILKLETGECMIALSDGMGTGAEAGDESETVMSLLEQMIEAGFKAETAIKLINSSLVLKSDKQTFSTIDMALVNLFNGMCEFIKIGAAAAFIKREHWIETISSTTLPIGMFGNVDYDTVTKKLYEGDIVIMVTDGVLDCIEEINKEACMEKIIIDIKSTNPQEIANQILERMLSESNYVPKDDMTVICAGMWLK